MVWKLPRIRFSVRALLVAFSLLAIVLACLAAAIRPYHEQNRGFHAIFFTHRVSVSVSDKCPDVIRATLPKGYYSRINELHFNKPDHDDETLETLAPHIKGLDKLRRVDFRNCGVSDDGLAHLADLPNVKMIWLNGKEFTDAGLKHLCKMKGLEKLNLTGTNISEYGVAKLRDSLPNCEISGR